MRYDIDFDSGILYPDMTIVDLAEVAAEVVRLCRDDAVETGRAIVLSGRSR